MQVMVITNYDNKEEKVAIENATSISEFQSTVAINFKDDDGCNKTQFIGLDGYTELIIRQIGTRARSGYTGQKEDKMGNMLKIMKDRLEEYKKEYEIQMEYYIISIEGERTTTNFERNSIDFMARQNELRTKINELSFWISMIESLTDIGETKGMEG